MSKAYNIICKKRYISFKALKSTNTINIYKTIYIKKTKMMKLLNLKRQQYKISILLNTISKTISRYW